MSECLLRIRDLCLRFGGIVALDLAPGLHARWPWPFETDRIVAMDRARRLEFGIPPLPSREASTRVQLRGRPACGSNAAPEPSATPGVWFQKETSSEDAFLLTGDSNLIDLRSAAQYRVKLALNYAYNLAEPDALGDQDPGARPGDHRDLPVQPASMSGHPALSFRGAPGGRPSVPREWYGLVPSIGFGPVEFRFPLTPDRRQACASSSMRECSSRT